MMKNQWCSKRSQSFVRIVCRDANSRVQLTNISIAVIDDSSVLPEASMSIPEPPKPKSSKAKLESKVRDRSLGSRVTTDPHLLLSV